MGFYVGKRSSEFAVGHSKITTISNYVFLCSKKSPPSLEQRQRPLGPCLSVCQCSTNVTHANQTAVTIAHITHAPAFE